MLLIIKKNTEISGRISELQLLSPSHVFFINSNSKISTNIQLSVSFKTFGVEFYLEPLPSEKQEDILVYNKNQRTVGYFEGPFVEF